jgi:hypothetical protein
LLRRVHPKWIVDDGAGGTMPASNTFQDSSGDGAAMSVYVEEKLRELGREAGDVVARYAGYGLVAFKASLARECGLTLAWAPDSSDPDCGEAHALVCGRKTGSIQKRLRTGCERRVWPDAPH